MGLEEIIKNIENDTKAKVKQILDDAQKEADKIKVDAELQASSHLNEVQVKANSDAKQIQMREMSRANTEAKAIFQSVLNESIKGSFNQVYDGLNDYVKSEDYSKLLAKLVQLASSELGEGCKIYVQKQDLQKVKGKQSANLLEAKEKFIGGLRGTSKDGKMYVDYSLEHIVESLRDQISVNILKSIND